MHRIMKYLSTRDKSLRLTASQAIAQGLSRDGGLLTPESFPTLTPAMLEDICRGCAWYPVSACKKNICGK